MRSVTRALAALGVAGVAALAAAPALAQNCSVWLVESSRFMNVPYGAFMPDRVFVPAARIRGRAIAQAALKSARSTVRFDA